MSAGNSLQTMLTKDTAQVRRKGARGAAEVGGEKKGLSEEVTNELKPKGGEVSHRKELGEKHPR